MLSLADENMEVRTEDAHQMVKRLAREEGILAGVSAGAALWACLRSCAALAARRARRDRSYFPRFRRKISERPILERGMSGVPLKIKDELLRQIHAHGVETYPHECCGAMLGRDGDASRDVLGLAPAGESPGRFAAKPL